MKNLLQGPQVIVVLYIDVILLMDHTESEHIANKKGVETLSQTRNETYMRKVYLHTKRDTISVIRIKYRGLIRKHVKKHK